MKIVNYLLDEEREERFRRHWTIVIAIPILGGALVGVLVGVAAFLWAVFHQVP